MSQLSINQLGEKTTNSTLENPADSSWFSNPYLIYFAMAFVVVLILVYIYHSYYKSEKLTVEESSSKPKKKKTALDDSDDDDNPVDKLIDSIEDRQAENEK